MLAQIIHTAADRVSLVAQIELLTVGRHGSSRRINVDRKWILQVVVVAGD